MTKHDDGGGPAFPHHEVWDEERPEIGWIGGGMTLRDYFAAKAMQASMINNGAQYAGNYIEHAKQAYAQADAMLDEREPKP